MPPSASTRSARGRRSQSSPPITAPPTPSSATSHEQRAGFTALTDIATRQAGTFARPRWQAPRRAEEVQPRITICSGRRHYSLPYGRPAPDCTKPAGKHVSRASRTGPQKLRPTARSWSSSRALRSCFSAPRSRRAPSTCSCPRPQAPAPPPSGTVRPSRATAVWTALLVAGIDQAPQRGAAAPRAVRARPSLRRTRPRGVPFCASASDRAPDRRAPQVRCTRHRRLPLRLAPPASPRDSSTSTTAGLSGAPLRIET